MTKRYSSVGEMVRDLSSKEYADQFDETMKDREALLAPLWAELASLREVNAKLVDALKPFAHQARVIDVNHEVEGKALMEDAVLFRFCGSYTAITLGDCRRAQAALRAAQESEGAK